MDATATLGRVLKATQPLAVVPLWMFVGAFALLLPPTPSASTLALAVVGVVAASLAALHVEALASSTLDARRQPPLWKWLPDDDQRRQLVIAAEFTTAAVVLLWLLARGNLAEAGFLGTYAAIAGSDAHEFLRKGAAGRTRSPWERLALLCVVASLARWQG